MLMNGISRREIMNGAIGMGGLALTTLATRASSAIAAQSTDVRPFRIDVPQAELDSLKVRLDLTRWPEKETVGDMRQGVPLVRMRALVEHWRTKYDWRKVETQINAHPQFMTTIDGVDIHFLHIRSKHPDATPMIMTHGWPGSIVEMLKVIGPLTDPVPHGGKPEDAFHLVLPSIPGHGFSGKPTEEGWGRERVARAWSVLMVRLGYDRYVAQGGDWGSVITQELARQAPKGLIGIHVNMPAVVPKVMPANLGPDEQAAKEALEAFSWDRSGYAHIMMTRPQSIGYGLDDSPVGLAAWIYEKFIDWTDSGGRPETVLSTDEMLDDIMMYWLTNSGASSARFYWNNNGLAFYPVGIDLPVGVSVFPGEIYKAPLSWSKAAFPHLIYYNKVARGGHFAAFEQPVYFVREVRSCFAELRADPTARRSPAR